MRRTYGRRDPHSVPVEHRAAEAILYGRHDVAQKSDPGTSRKSGPIDGTPQEPMIGDKQKFGPAKGQPIQPRDHGNR